MNLISDIIWDFDGTLLDTYPETVNAFLKALSSKGIQETNENIRNLVKVSEGYAISQLNELYGLDDSFILKYQEYKKKITMGMVKPFPFAEEVCSRLTEQGGRNFILTHRGDSTLQYLRYYGMESYFTEIVTKKYGFKRKPDPEGFVYLIEKYRMNRSLTLVVGDRECEIAGGKAAGIKTCLYDTNQVSLSIKPDYHIETLMDLLDIVK